MNVLLTMIIALNLSLTSGMETRFYKDDGVRIIEETDLNAWIGNFAFGLNYSLFHPETSMAFQRRLGILKGFMETHNDNVLLRVGTAYTTFGRGLSLYAAKDDVLEMDRFVNGLYLEISKGAALIKGIGGISKVYIDHKLQEDSTSLLIGADVTLNVIEGVQLGGSILDSRDVNGFNTNYYSFRTDIGSGNFAFYFEFGARTGYNKTILAEKNGYADYLSVSYSTESFGAVAEFRDYWLFGKEYGIPPTLNKSGIYLNDAMDERAFALTLNFAPSDFYTMNLNLSKLYSTGYFGPKSELNEVNFQNQFQGESRFAEFDLNYLKITGGNVAIGVDNREEIDPQIDFGFRSAGLEWELYFSNRKRDDDGVKYTDRDVALTLGFLEDYDVTFTLQDRSGDLTNRWSNVEFKGQIFDNFSLILTVGSMRGDFICSGGICRYEPEFDGVIVKAVIVF